MSVKNLVFLLCFFNFHWVIVGQSLDHKEWEINYNKGMELVEKDSIKSALPYLSMAYTIAADKFKSKSKYGETLYQFYNACIINKRYSTIDSLSLTAELLDYSSSLIVSKRLKYASNIESLADSLLKFNQFPKAIKLYNERTTVLELAGDTASVAYAKTLHGLGKSYKGTNKNNFEAKENLEKALAIVEPQVPSDELRPEIILIDLVAVYIGLGKKDKADSAVKKTLGIIAAKDKKISASYAKLLDEITVIYWRSELLEDAKKYQSESLRVYEQMDDDQSMDYLSANYVLALIEKDNSNYLESIRALKKVKEVFINSNQANNKNYASVLGQIALNYNRIGDYENAINFCNQALNVSEISLVTRSIRLMDKAYFYQNMGQYEMSYKVYDEALEAMEISHGKKHSEYAKLLNNIGKLYFEEGKFDDALIYFKNALGLIETPEGTKWHSFYSYMLNDYAKTLFEINETERSIELMKKNISYFDSNAMPKNEAYYNRKHSLAKAYNLTGDYQTALPLIEDASQNLGEILGEEHIDYGQFLKTISNTYFGLEMTNKAIMAIEQSNAISVNQIDKIFQFSSEQEKKAFLKMITRNFNEMQSIALSKDLNNDKLNALNLNNQLMLKGLLLNNSKDITFELNKLNNEDINSKISSYKRLKNKIAKLLTEPLIDRNMDADSLMLVINGAEAELVKIYTSNFQGRISLVRNWENVKKELKGDEVAVEFSHFNLIKKGKQTDSILYVAYVYGRESANPKLVPLFEEQQLKSLLAQNQKPNTLYRSTDLYNLIWKPLAEYIDENTTVYYSPSGLLNQLSFSAMPHEKDVLINTYNLVQLSSTNVLVNKQSEPDVSSSLFVGGINYEYSAESTESTESNDSTDSTDSADSVDAELIADNDTFNYLESSSLLNSRGTKSRGESWTYLQGTLFEIESLKTKFEAQGNSVVTLSKNDATEENFKKLSGHSPNILHIATHGFFYENININAQYLTDLSTEDQYRLAEDPLLRSGLILAGANYYWKNGSNPPNEEEDGILTAMEISNLDLSNTDMVVLSACETGLGDIDGSEGVYGLQRAFKMAGVNKLIMSLWDVPDEETAEFMQEFYGYWLEGSSSREAFIYTQRQMYKKYKNEPHKWAAFVLFE